MEAEAPLTAAALRLEQRVDERTAEVSRVTTAAVTAAVAGINAPTRVQSVVDRAVIATTARSPRQLQHRDALATTLPHADVLSFLPSLDRTVQTAKHFSVQQAQQSNFRDTTVPEAAAAAVVGGGGHGGLSTVTARSADNGAVDTAKSSSSLLLPALAASSTSVGLQARGDSQTGSMKSSDTAVAATPIDVDARLARLQEFLRAAKAGHGVPSAEADRA